MAICAFGETRLQETTGIRRWRVYPVAKNCNDMTNRWRKTNNAFCRLDCMADKCNGQLDERNCDSVYRLH